MTLNVLFCRDDILPALEKKHEEALLDEFFLHWENFKVYVYWMRKAFTWVDQYALPNHKNKEDPNTPVTLFNISYGIFAKTVQEFLSTKFF